MKALTAGYETLHATQEYIMPVAVSAVLRPRYCGLLHASTAAIGAAVVRTTVGVTSMNAGSADNMLPETGSVLFNFRLLPHEHSTPCMQVCWEAVGMAFGRLRLGMSTKVQISWLLDSTWRNNTHQAPDIIPKSGISRHRLLSVAHHAGQLTLATKQLSS